MSTFTAVKAGPLSDGDTFGLTSPGTEGTHWPNESDHVLMAGYNLTQGTATGVGSITDLVSGYSTLTLTDSFTCPDVQEVEIIVPNTTTATIAFGTSGVNPGCYYSGTMEAIKCEAGGTVTDVTGDLTNSGSDYAVSNYGIWQDFSGNLYNTGFSADGAYNAATWTNFSGKLYNSGSYLSKGAWNDAATWTNFSGELHNTGDGIGAKNTGGGTWTDFSGTLYLGSLVGKGIDGDAIPFSGDIKIAPQADLLAENILTTKTILGVAGTFDEAARNTDPGVGNVRSSTAYKIGNAAKTGTLDITADNPAAIIAASRPFRIGD